MPNAVLRHGNSEEILKEILSESIDAICCDPPFGISFNQHEWDRTLPDLAIWKECLRVLKPGGYLAAFGASPTSHRLTADLESLGFKVCGRMAWIYPNGTPACQRIDDEHWARVKPAHEDIIVVMKPLAARTYHENRQKYGTGGLRVKNTIGDGRMTTSILSYNKPTQTERNLGAEHLPKKPVVDREECDRSLYSKVMRNNNHPCVKPIALLSHLCKLIADPDAIILDPFMGSGSAGMAAIWSGLNYIGIEIDEGYFEIAKSRVGYALNNSCPSFPLTAAARRNSLAAGEREGCGRRHVSQEISALFKVEETYALVDDSDLGADCAVDDREVPVRWHTEEAGSATDIRPNSSDAPLISFGLVEMSPLVFDDKCSPVIKNRNEIGIESATRKLEPERGLLPVDVPDPVSDLRVPVDVDRAIELLPTIGEVATAMSAGAWYCSGGASSR